MSERQPPRDAGPEAPETALKQTTNPSIRGGFLGFVAHEMRNPLSTALWSAELLVRLAPEERAGARGEKLSNMALRALQRLRVLVEDHFLAERLEVNGIPFKLEPVGLREVLDQVAGKAGVEVSIALEGEVAVQADRSLLERGLEALLAVAGRGKVPVAVEVERSGGSAVVRFRGEPPAPGALDVPQKGTLSDPTGRALALLMASRVARTVGGELAATGEAYLLTLPLAAGEVP